MKKAVFTWFFLSSAFLFAQQEWTLKKCIETALQNNLQIKMQENNVWFSKHRLQQSYTLHLPTLNAMATHIYNFGQTIDPYTNQFANTRVRSNNFAIQGQWTIFAGGQNLNLLKQNAWQYKADRSIYEKQKNEIILTIANLYLTALLRKESMENARLQMEITQQQKNRIEKMVNAGMAREIEEKNLNAQYMAEKANFINAENQYKSALLNLKQAMLLSSADTLILTVPDIEYEMQQGIPLESVEVIYEKCEKNMPQIRAAEESLRAAEYAFRASRGAFYPRIVLSASLGTGYSGLQKEVTGVTYVGYDTLGFTTGGEYVLTPAFDVQTRTMNFIDQLDRNFNQSVGVTLSVPIFNAWNARLNKQRMEVAMKNAAWQVEQARQQLYMEVETAYQNIFLARQTYEARKTSRDAFYENFRYVQVQYEAGVVDIFQYYDVKNKWMKAESDLIQAKYDLIFRMKILDFYMGKNIQ